MSLEPAQASDLIDALGGTTAVAKLTKNPDSTVHSWRKNGLNAARLDHLRLASIEAGKEAEFESGIAGHQSTVRSASDAASPGKRDDIAAQQVAA